jgi:dCMP deaminase
MPNLPTISEKELKWVVSTTRSISTLSTAVRLNVGASLWDVRKRTLISIGYNGTPRGMSNVCETQTPDGKLETLPFVIHAEINCLHKLSWWSRVWGELMLTVTHAPCLSCAEQIALVPSIRTVIYLEPYRDTTGIQYLSQHKSVIRLYTP